MVPAWRSSVRLTGGSEREQTTWRSSCPNTLNSCSRLPRSGDRVQALPVPGVKNGHRLPSQGSLECGGACERPGAPPRRQHGTATPAPGAGGQGSHRLLRAPRRNRRGRLPLPQRAVWTRLPTKVGDARNQRRGGHSTNRSVKATKKTPSTHPPQRSTLRSSTRTTQAAGELVESGR